MADRLRDLLHREAERLVVPPPRGHETLDRGRRMRRRRTVVVAAAGVAAALVVVGGVGVGLSRSGEDDRPDTAGDPRSAAGAVFAVGSTVYLDGGERSVSVGDRAVTAISYTSAGAVVRHGDGSASGGPEYSLVTAAGQVEALAATNPGLAQGSDPGEPYLAWAERGDSGNDDAGATVVVWDVEADTEVARLAVPGASAGYLPVALDGDTVYVGSGLTTYAVDWRSGQVARSPLLRGTTEVAGGSAVVPVGRDTSSVRDLGTGETLAPPLATGERVLGLSPDGRFVQWLLQEGVSFAIGDLETGERVTIEGNAYEFGWAPGGDVFRVNGATVTTCSSVTGECVGTTLEAPPPARGQLVLGGL